MILCGGTTPLTELYKFFRNILKKTAINLLSTMSVENVLFVEQLKLQNMYNTATGEAKNMRRQILALR